MRFVAGRGADKACCRQRRCGEAVAGRGPSAQRTAGRDAAAKSHREASKERAPAVSKERARAAGRERAPRAASEQKRERQNPLS